MRTLVIPSNRESHLRDFFAAWEGRGGWDRVIVVEDGPERTFAVPAGAAHYSWAEITQAVGDDAWIFSRRDSAIRAFGFLAAWHAGADHVLTLDDDCYPTPEQQEGGSFFDEHRAAMIHPRWATTVPGFRVRGLPYQNTGFMEGVVANVGLWTGHPDIDAVASLMAAAGTARPRYTLPHHNWLVPRGQYVPVCGMNLCFTRAALPLFFFPPQGEGQPYRRFDDIWAGVIAKRIADHLGWSFSVGEPFVEHQRASDPFVNLVKEAPGVGANETFWEAIDAVRLTADTAIGCIRELGAALRVDADAYRRKLGLALGVWAKLLDWGSGKWH